SLRGRQERGGDNCGPPGSAGGWMIPERTWSSRLPDFSQGSPSGRGAVKIISECCSLLQSFLQPCLRGIRASKAGKVWWMDQRLRIETRMRASLSDLTRAERQVATHILSHFPMSALGSITTLARAADVSSPTIVRLVQKLGFKGW